MQPSSPSRSGHGTLAIGLNLEQFNRTIGKTKVNTLGLNENLTLAKRHINRRSIEHAHGLAGNHATSRRGIGRSEHMTHTIERSHLRIQTHLQLGNLGSMSDERLILLSPHGGAIGKRRKRIGKQFAAKLTKLHRERLGMLTGNGRGNLSTISTSIHAMSNAHDRNASNLITSENRTLNRSSPTPMRQQGRMNINNAERRHMQDLIRQNAAISSHAENVSMGRLKRLNNLRRHTIGLNNGQTKLKRLSLNRGRLQLLTTPTNSIRTSNNQHNFIASLNKRSQRRHSKIRRTHKHNTHKGRLPSTKAETATNNSGKPSHQPIRNNISTRTNIPKTKERAAIKAALPTKQLSAKTPLPGPRHPGETSSVNVVSGAPAYIVPRAVSQCSENV